MITNWNIQENQIIIWPTEKIFKQKYFLTFKTKHFNLTVKVQKIWKKNFKNFVGGARANRTKQKSAYAFFLFSFFHQSNLKTKSTLSFYNVKFLMRQFPSKKLDHLTNEIILTAKYFLTTTKPVLSETPKISVWLNRSLIFISTWWCSEFDYTKPLIYGPLSNLHWAFWFYFVSFS